MSAISKVVVFELHRPTFPCLPPSSPLSGMSASVQRPLAIPSNTENVTIFNVHGNQESEPTRSVQNLTQNAESLTVTATVAQDMTDHSMVKTVINEVLNDFVKKVRKLCKKTRATERQKDG